MGKFEMDKTTATEIIGKGKNNITHDDRMTLLKIFQVPFHDDGKIEGIYSIDSSCNGCSFCQKIRESGKDNPLLICNYCYDNAQEMRWVNVRNRHGLQLLIMSEVEFTVEELSTLKIEFICRFNSSGDIENVTMAKNYVNIMYAHPEVFFGLFAKNTLPVVIAMDMLGKPDNVKCIQSSPIIGQPVKKLAKYFDVRFTVYPDEESTLNAIENGAMECNGKKCKECGYRCYLPEYMNGWAHGTNIAELLRLKNKNDRLAVLTAYYNK